MLYKFLEKIDVLYYKWISTFVVLLSVPFTHEHRESVCGKLLHLSANLLQLFRFLFRFVVCFKGIDFGRTTVPPLREALGAYITQQFKKRYINNLLKNETIHKHNCYPWITNVQVTMNSLCSQRFLTLTRVIN